MEALIEQHLENPLILAGLLFAATFILEEAAILLAAGLSAAGELSAGLALIAIAGGVITSDWLIYGLGVLAGRSRRVAMCISPEQLERGRRLLQRSALVAGLLARLIPWLLFPVFIASGFLGVGFRRFALINGVIAIAYILALFFGAFGLFAVLLASLGGWAWVVGSALVLLIVWGGRYATKRYFPASDDPDA